jgi:hypothetical protein
VEQGIPHRAKQDDIPLETQDYFKPDVYETSLSTTISRISEAIISAEEETKREPCNSQRQLYHSLDPFISHSLSIEPLYFLGINPIAEKAALLSAYKFTLSPLAHYR